MNPTPQAWQRLVDAARRAPDERDSSAPYGFAVRVAARAFTERPPFGSLFERFSLRAMGVAGLLALVAVAANYSSVRRLFDHETTAADDPTAELVDLVSS